MLLLLLMWVVVRADVQEDLFKVGEDRAGLSQVCMLCDCAFAVSVNFS